MSRSPSSRNERGRSQPTSRNRAARRSSGNSGERTRRRGGPQRERTAARRPDRPRRWLRWVLVALLSAITVLVIVAYVTPVFGVRTVRVTGNAALSDHRLREAAGVRPGEPMLRLNSDEIGERLREIPQVARADVELSWPSTVTLSVTERDPAVYAVRQGKYEILDASGVRFAQRDQRPRNLPELKVPSGAPGPDDAATRAAMTALRALPPRIREHTVAVVARSPGDIHLQLDGDRRVRWGGPDESARKAAILPPLLTRPGSVYDVITPELPTVS